MLLQLEDHVKKYGKIPDTLYLQVDGGPENANQYMLAFCELLIAKGVAKEVFLTRLPVGHTHEDIDAYFGHIWKRTRNNPIHTPQVRKYDC